MTNYHNTSTGFYAGADWQHVGCDLDDGKYSAFIQLNNKPSSELYENIATKLWPLITVRS